ncbi:MAG: DUF971 domain-containing protein [Alphaproteobacteria bacterium]|nr:DUF971 domain-containing protein [Alphaproteobacteria bacterium]
MADRFSAAVWPVEVTLRQAEKSLVVAWEDGRSDTLAAEYLRVESPSAEVQGHGPGQKMLVAGRRHVGILKLEPVGNNAIRIVFDDLHDSGIYSWSYLRQLADEYGARWAEYLQALEAQGKRRDP